MATMRCEQRKKEENEKGNHEQVEDARDWRETMMYLLEMEVVSSDGAVPKYSPWYRVP